MGRRTWTWGAAVAMVAIALAGTAAAGDANKSIAGGPENAASPAPDNGATITAAEQAVRDQLIDPDSAKFRSERATEVGWAKHGAFGSRIDGPISMACGEVNARNRMGGYSGFAWFLVAIKDGQVLWSDLDDATDDAPGSAFYGCKNVGLTG